MCSYFSLSTAREGQESPSTQSSQQLPWAVGLESSHSGHHAGHERPRQQAAPCTNPGRTAIPKQGTHRTVLGYQDFRERPGITGSQTPATRQLPSETHRQGTTPRWWRSSPNHCEQVSVPRAPHRLGGTGEHAAVSTRGQWQHGMSLMLKSAGDICWNEFWIDTLDLTNTLLRAAATRSPPRTSSQLQQHRLQVLLLRLCARKENKQWHYFRWKQMTTMCPTLDLVPKLLFKSMLAK